MTDPGRDAYLDALAWLTCYLNGDSEGKSAIALNCDPARVMDAVTIICCRLMEFCTDDQPHEYISYIRANLDELLDRREK